MSCALPFHTSVPCDKPLILTSSAKVVGFVSFTMPITNFVNSGKASAPVSQLICSGVTPRAVVEVNKLITFLSSIGISFISIPVLSSRYLNIVGLSCPSISNFNKHDSIS